MVLAAFVSFHPPTFGRVIVMSSCVNDSVNSDVFGFVRVVFVIVIKGELQNAHPFQLVALAQFSNLFWDYSKVFSNNAFLASAHFD